MTTRWDKGPVTGLRYHRAGWLHASTTWKKQMFLFFFRLEATVLINNLSHTTTNPRVNVGNTSLFPSLSFYHKHINISLTRVLRCTARPAGSQQAASTLCAQKAMLKCEAVSRSYRHRQTRLCVCACSGMSVYTWCVHRFLYEDRCVLRVAPECQSQNPVRTVNWKGSWKSQCFLLLIRRFTHPCPRARMIYSYCM